MSWRDRTEERWPSEHKRTRDANWRDEGSSSKTWRSENASDRKDVFSRLGPVSSRARQPLPTAIWNERRSDARSRVLGFRSALSTAQVTSTLPMVCVEESRELALLKDFFVRETRGHKVPMLALVRWLHNQQTGCGLLPSHPRSAPGLFAELTKAGVPEAKAREICQGLAERSISAKQRLSQLELPDNQPVTAMIDQSIVSLEFASRRISLHRVHYDKLAELHKRSGHDATRLEADVFCLVSRYDALQDTGFQAALGEGVFDVLLDQLGIDMECFASPLNCRYDTFCSAFTDTDAAFGSMGSFFEFWPTAGSYEANPPFVEEVMERMAAHIQELLDLTQDALSFSVFIPAWTDTPCWPILQQSKYLRFFLAVSKGEHGYCVGDQHVNPKRSLPATFETAVFILQTEAAAAKWPVTKSVIEELKSAFRSSLPKLSAQDQQYLDDQLRRKRERDRRDGRPHAEK
eukprot:c13625_g1_i1.p1 GENE.c13625_g1_i1~~c13625_g1_i1.p1  ORF type:complete len:462 (-),score=74.75 c13625_g1_i1:198-1583(-)